MWNLAKSLVKPKHEIKSNKTKYEILAIIKNINKTEIIFLWLYYGRFKYVLWHILLTFLITICMPTDRFVKHDVSDYYTTCTNYTDILLLIVNTL